MNTFTVEPRVTNAYHHEQFLPNKEVPGDERRLKRQTHKPTTTWAIVEEMSLEGKVGREDDPCCLILRNLYKMGCAAKFEGNDTTLMKQNQTMAKIHFQ